MECIKHFCASEWPNSEHTRCRLAVHLDRRTETRRLDGRSYAMRVPGQSELRVTTDPALYEQNADTMELWSPGGPVFPDPMDGDSGDDAGLLRNITGR